MNESAPQGEQWDEKCVLGHCGSPSGCERDLRCRADCAAPQGGDLRENSDLSTDVLRGSRDLSTAATQAAPSVAAIEREAFEAAMRKMWTLGYAFPRNRDGDYLHANCDLAWRVWQARAVLPLPAVVQAAPGDVHPAAPSSPSALRAAPFSEPRALGQGELPVRAEMEPWWKDPRKFDIAGEMIQAENARDAARWRWLVNSFSAGRRRIWNHVLDDEIKSDHQTLEAAIDAAMSAPGGGGRA